MKHGLFILASFLLLSVATNGQKGENRAKHPIVPEALPFELVPETDVFMDPIDTILPGFLMLRTDHAFATLSESELFYKSRSGWTKINIPYNQLEIDTLNLDNKGRPEIIVRAEGCNYGSGGGTCSGAFMVIGIDSVPIVLMDVKNICSEEIFPRQFEDGGNIRGKSVSFTRQITVADRSVKIAGMTKKQRRQWREIGCACTAIPAGTYRLVHGNMVRVKN